MENYFSPHGLLFCICFRIMDSRVLPNQTSRPYKHGLPSPATEKPKFADFICALTWYFATCALDVAAMSLAWLLSWWQAPYPLMGDPRSIVFFQSI